MATVVVTKPVSAPSWKTGEHSNQSNSNERVEIPFSAIPYYISYLVPVFIFLGIYNGGWWTYAVLFIAYGLVPALDLILPVDEVNPTKEQEKIMEKMVSFAIVTWLWPPVQLVTVLICCWFASCPSASLFEIIGCAIGCGIMGALGINIAHELAHKRNSFERFIAQISLLCSAYLHFMIEHNQGHHTNVATPEDPATSRYGQTFYEFWPVTVFGGMASAWRIEKERLKKSNLPLWSVHNNMLAFILSPILLSISIYYFLGLKAAIFYLIQAIIGFSHLEVVNYIEHYGLERAKLSEGVYEIVTPLHSWNAPYQLSNYFLFKLQRHSDHHAWPTRRYQILRSFPESPALPTGYPGMVLLSLVPPLFFKVMNPRVEQVRAQYKTKLESSPKNM